MSWKALADITGFKSVVAPACTDLSLSWKAVLMQALYLPTMIIKIMYRDPKTSGQCIVILEIMRRRCAVHPGCFN